MSIITTIYDKCPIFLQNIMISSAGYLYNRNRYGRKYYEHLQFLNEFDKYSREQQQKYQNNELGKFINYAVTHSKFYRGLYKNVDISTIKTIEDLKKLPIVDKEILRENISDIYTTKTSYVESHTGGTTGKSLVVRFTSEDMMKHMAVLDHFKKRHGFISLQMKRATFNGKHIVPPSQRAKKFWRYNAACKQMIFSSFHITEKNIPYYIEELNRFQPQAIDGFFTSICDVASYAERHNMAFTFMPVAIFPTSETVTESGRALLERVFKAKVYNQYASSEGAPFITDCPGQKLHIEMCTGVFEHFKENSNEVLVTSFHTYGTPLIRYRIGDNIVFEDIKMKCSCGLKSPCVQNIEGRSLDFLYTPEGAKIYSVNVANLFKNMPNVVIKSQILQEKINEIVILMEVDKSKYKKTFDDLLKNEVEHKFGKKMNVIIKHVDNIPKAKSGKSQFIINRIAMEQ